MTCSALRILLISIVVVCPWIDSAVLHAGDLSVLAVDWEGDAANPLFTGRDGQWDALIRERG